MKEFAVSAPVGNMRKSQKYGAANNTIEPKKVSEVPINTVIRVSTGFAEFDRVLGQETKSGIVPGSVILLSGDPGVGKSTILLQTALNLAFQNKKILYVTGEESEAQVTMRPHCCARIAGRMRSVMAMTLSTIAWNCCSHT